MLCRLRTLLGRVLLTLLLFPVAYDAHALTFPELTGRVVDNAGVLDPATKASLERKLAEPHRLTRHACDRDLAVGQNQILFGTFEMIGGEA